MADNFNLRQFLTENKLTKNTQLLAEGSDYGYEALMDVVDTEYDGDPAIAAAVEDAFHNGDIDTSEFGHDLNAPSNAVAQIANGMDIEAAQQSMGFEEGVEDLEEFSPYGSMAFSGDDKPKQREPKEGEVELSTLNKGDIFRTAEGSPIEFRVWGHNPTGGVDVQYTDYKFPRPNYTMRDTTMVVKLDGEDDEQANDIEQAQHGIERQFQETVNEASYKTSANSKEAQHLKKGDIVGSGDEVVSVSAGAKTPSGKVEVTLKTKSGKTKVSTWGKTTKVGLKAKETVKENTMTQRDRYLTRLVENALGLNVTEDDNVDYTMGRQDDPNQLPNPAPELNIPEGDEMVNEKPMPKYESIEKLMQEIDKNTDEEAHKFKMQEMKRVADGLEKKATALEEGDDADHIDQKKLKQMKKDIMTLRKGIEKMEKLGDKKFTKKETKADLKEGSFDLRKFLIENRK